LVFQEGQELGGGSRTFVRGLFASLSADAIPCYRAAGVTADNNMCLSYFFLVSQLPEETNRRKKRGR
jgi:hypothetical protein